MGYANVWYTGHVPTGAEMERQIAAWRSTRGGGDSFRFTVLDALARIPDGIPTAVIAVPSTTTWARGRHASPLGPKPLRDISWPWGLPWLAPREQAQVDAANTELRQAMQVVVAALDRAPAAHIMILHPEQLGPAPRGSPATIWDLPELRRWAARAGMMRAATYQCRFGATEYRFPIGILSSQCLNSKLFDKGWPTITSTPARYYGPLPPFCTCSRRAHRARALRTTRVAGGLDAPLIKDGFMQYLISLLARDAAQSNVAELLRLGNEHKPEVRDGMEPNFNSSDDQPTWIPTDSDHSEIDTTQCEERNRISWDRELSSILSLNERGATVDQQATHLNLHTDERDHDYRQDIQDQHSFQDSPTCFDEKIQDQDHKVKKGKRDHASV